MRDDETPAHPWGTDRNRSFDLPRQLSRTLATQRDDGGETIDLVAVQADDELINALAAGLSVPSQGSSLGTDDHVAAVLAAWRNDVDQEPIPELVDVDTAIATVRRARPRSRARHLAPVAAAAAFVVLAVGGVTLGSSTATPGDALWDVSKVLYSQRAQSLEAAGRVQTHIDAAKQALLQGQPAVASRELQAAATDIAVVRPEDGRTALADVQEFLTAKAAETPAGTPTDPATPLRTDQHRKVPAGAAVGQTPSPTSKPAAPPPPSSPAPEPGTSNGPSGGTSSGAGTSTGTGTGTGSTSPDPRVAVQPAPATQAPAQSSAPEPAASPTTAPTTAAPSSSAPAEQPPAPPASPTSAPGQSMGPTTEGTPDSTASQATPSS